jgi:putative membrane protein
MKISEQKFHLLLLFIGILVFIWSYVDHKSTFGWTLLSAPVVIAAIFFTWTYKKFTFSSLVYFLGFLWACLLLWGAKYTFTYVPFFEYLSDVFGWTRNYFDRSTHFAQGFVPYLIFREYLLRKGILTSKKLTNLVLFTLVLGFSASWELIEFSASIISGRSQSFILDMQGDIWDTQMDMVFALVGAISSSIILGKLHLSTINKKMTEMKPRD